MVTRFYCFGFKRESCSGFYAPATFFPQQWKSCSMHKEQLSICLHFFCIAHCMPSHVVAWKHTVAWNIHAAITFRSTGKSFHDPDITHRQVLQLEGCPYCEEVAVKTDCLIRAGSQGGPYEHNLCHFDVARITLHLRSAVLLLFLISEKHCALKFWRNVYFHIYISNSVGKT